MDSSTILTMLGLTAAVLAIIPKESKLDLSLRISKFDWTVIIVSLIFIHYIMYYPVINELGFKYNFGKWKFGFNENNTTYLIFVFMSLYLIIRFRFFKINKGNIEKFSELLEQLILKKKYEEASILVEKYFKDIEKIKRSTSFINRLVYKIKPKNDFDMCFEIEERTDSCKFMVNEFLIKLSSIITVDDSYKDKASAIVSRMFNNKGFIKFFAESKPYYFLELLTSKSLYSDIQIKNFFNGLIDDKSSVFYYEIENNQNLKSGNRYFLDPNNKLLFGLLSDCSLAKDLAVYKPIGDRVNDLLDYDDKLIDKYNEPLGNYYESGLYQCPIYCGLQFFNIMIFESLYQNIKWHMWLYYYQSFTKKIIKDLNVESKIDLSKEWPTPFHFHLYTITTNCLDWVYEVDAIENKNILNIDGSDLNHDNGSILKSSILCLGNITYQIISTNKLSRDFKLYILEIVLRELVNNRFTDNYNLVNKLVMKSIVYNGYFNKIDIAYAQDLHEIFSEVDHVITSELDDFKDLLETVLMS
ncbi:hypothetical protein KW474_11835 [Vibrio fluvialis]|nr:hypothetical protein [Vibrio fluvialis]